EGRGERPALPADGVAASESEFGALELSVNPDRGGKSDFIAAARRAAQAGRDVAPANDASAVSKIALATDGSESDVGRWRALIGGTAAILMVVGLLQIARILVAPSDGVKLAMPSDTAVSRDATPPAVEAAAGGAGRAPPAPTALFPGRARRRPFFHPPTAQRLPPLKPAAWFRYGRPRSSRKRPDKFRRRGTAGTAAGPRPPRPLRRPPSPGHPQPRSTSTLPCR